MKNKKDPKDPNIITRNIKLKMFPVGDKAVKNQCWQRLHDLDYSHWKASNRIMSSLHMNDSFLDYVCRSNGIDIKDMTQLVQQQARIAELFVTKQRSQIERNIVSEFPNLPSCISNSLPDALSKKHIKQKHDILCGNASLPTFRREIPIYTSKSSISFEKGMEDVLVTENGKSRVEAREFIYVIWTLSRTEKLRLKIAFGRDRANYRDTIDKIMKGEINFGAPQVKVESSEIFLFLPIKDKIKEAVLDPTRVLGLDLGMVIPIYAALNDGKVRKPFGVEDTILRVRLQLSNRRRKLQKVVSTLARHGHGYQRLCTAIEKMRDKEYRAIDTIFHKLSRAVVEFAIRHNAGVINMEDLSDYGKKVKDANNKDFNENKENRDKKDNDDAEHKKFMLRHCGYFKLQSMITYKAEAFGIKVVKVNPMNTSITCSQCGNVDKTQRISQDKFECKNENCTASNGKPFKSNADYNSAFNISKLKEGEILNSSSSKAISRVVIKPGSRLKSEDVKKEPIGISTNLSLTHRAQGVV